MPQRLHQDVRAESFDLRAHASFMMRVRENTERDPKVAAEILRRASHLREYLETIGYGVVPAAEQGRAKKSPSSPPPKNGKANGKSANGAAKHRAAR